MNSSRVFLLIALFLAGNANALEGSGYASDPDEARRRAAADLAAAIQVRVHSVVESCTQVTLKKPEDCGSRVLNRSATELPLLGLKYQEIPGGNEPSGAKAVLDAASSAPLYRAKLTELGKEFADGVQALATSKDRRQKHDLLTRQIAILRALADHLLVATALGVQADALPGSETGLAAEREALEETVDSIPFAARLLLKGIPGYIKEAEPLTAAGSREATPLGSALADALRAQSPAHRGRALKSTGEYRILTNGEVDVVVELRNQVTGELVGVRTARLAKAGYVGLRAEPLAPDFEKLLREGVAVSGDLRADLVTAAGTRQLKFKAGETVKLAARLNRAGYFYLVGHVVQPEGQFSYLMPLQAGPTNDASEARFIRYVPPEQVNHYLVLGEFSVEPPFGTEHLQIIASTQRPKDVLPAARYDSSTGYYVLQGSQGKAQEGLMKTRGLIQKAETKAMTAEGILSFTTSPR